MDSHSFISDNETFRLRDEWIKLARNERAAVKLHREHEWFSFFKNFDNFPIELPNQSSMHNGCALITTHIEGESTHDLYLNDELSNGTFELICQKLLELQAIPLRGHYELPNNLYDGKLERLGAAKKAKRLILPVINSVPDVTYSHGDYHLGNLLLTTSGSIAAIDPGDYTIFDPRYDWAKLYHSLRGYNHAIEGMIHRRNPHLEDIFFDHCPFEKSEITQLTGFLFLSMIPLHSLRNQRNLLNLANEILSPYWGENGAVSLADYSFKNEIFVDLDGTLVSLERNFEDGKPNVDLIDVLREYFDAGKRITIYTARGMKSHGGDIEKINKFVRPRIEEWLRENHVPYDELIVAKPLFDLLIDDNVRNIEDIKSWIF